MEPATFFLRDLPSSTMLRTLARRYPQMEPSAVEACALLLRTGSDLLATFESLLAVRALSQGGFLTLVVLNRDPDEEVTPSTLARKLGVTRATVTGLLDTLAKSGFIERLQHHDDRRRVLVRLTASGREHLDAMLPDYYRQIARVMEGVREHDRQALKRILATVNAGISAASASGTETARDSRRRRGGAR